MSNPLEIRHKKEYNVLNYKSLSIYSYGNQKDYWYIGTGVIGYDEKDVEARFGGMLSAFKVGAPPHAGCAFGIDRIFMILENTENIRDIVAFPKNGSGVDLMMNSPSNVDEYQIKDLHLQIVEEDEE